MQRGPRWQIATSSGKPVSIDRRTGNDSGQQPRLPCHDAKRWRADRLTLLIGGRYRHVWISNHPPTAIAFTKTAGSRDLTKSWHNVLPLSLQTIWRMSTVANLRGLKGSDAELLRVEYEPDGAS